MLYTLYGYTEADLAELRNEIVHAYVQMELIYQQFDALNLAETLDMEALKAEAAAAYESSAEGYQTYINTEGKTPEQIAQEARTLMESDGYDLAYFERMLYNQERTLAVLEYYTKEIAVTDEELRTYYDERVAQDKAAFEVNPAAYEEAVSYGESTMYVPEGFRAVKHILIQLAAEDADRMYTLEGELESVKLAIAEGSGDAAELNAQLKTIQDEIDAIFATIEPRAQELMDKLANGADFIELMNQYGEDPGMTYEPYMTDGYILYADSMSWVLPFRDGAMALEKPGDISQPVRTSYGLHIIRYEYDVVSGPVPFEEVQEALREELNETKLNDYVSGLLDQWYAEADIQLYPENLLK